MGKNKEQKKSEEKQSKQYAYSAKDAGKDILVSRVYMHGRGVIVRVINDNPLYINFYRTQSRAKSIVGIFYGPDSGRKLSGPA